MMIEDLEIENVWRRCLAPFPFYIDEDEAFAAVTDRPAICIGYNTNRKFAPAAINIQLEDSKCYILDIRVQENLRRKGVGRALMHCVENFARWRGVKILETNAAGIYGVPFALSLGFIKQTRSASSVKILC